MIPRINLLTILFNHTRKNKHNKTAGSFLYAYNATHTPQQNITNQSQKTKANTRFTPANQQKQKKNKSPFDLILSLCPLSLCSFFSRFGLVLASFAPV